MEIGTIQSHDMLVEHLKNSRRLFLLLYKKGSEKSDCAYRNLKKLENTPEDIVVLAADVTGVRDIHEKYGVSSVPAFLEFEQGKYKNLLKGCHEEGFYKSYFENIIYEMAVSRSDKPSKRVTLYTTPTCPWCTTVKNYLRKHRVAYTEVDVAADQNAARDMVAKSGQQGVPQTEIDGQMVIGFDQTKLNRLLEIQTN